MSDRLYPSYYYAKKQVISAHLYTYYILFKHVYTIWKKQPPFKLIAHKTRLDKHHIAIVQRGVNPFATTHLSTAYSSQVN